MNPHTPPNYYTGTYADERSPPDGNQVPGIYGGQGGGNPNLQPSPNPFGMMESLSTCHQ
jgi:hypothetical protein